VPLFLSEIFWRNAFRESERWRAQWWFARYKGPVEKMAFFDASGLYALNPQQEALNCIIFIFSDL